MTRRARHAPAALGAALAVLVSAAPVRAEVGATQYTLGLVGLRVNAGELTELSPWGLSLLFGVTLQPLQLGEIARMGPMVWAQIDWFNVTTAAAPAESLYLTQFGGALRVEFGVPRVPSLDVILFAGVELSRASYPVPPRDDTQAWGPVVGFGLDFGSAERSFGLTATYGIIGDGPQGVLVALSWNLGAR